MNDDRAAVRDDAMNDEAAVPEEASEDSTGKFVHEDVNGNNESLSTESSDAVEGGDSFDEWGDRRDYHLINAWSVIALVLALLSSAALLLPIFWIVPLLAIAASLIAIAKIRREPHLYIGYRMAVISLVLAALLGSWSVSRHQFFQARMFAVAEKNLDHWFELIRQGKLEEAHQLSLLVGMRSTDFTTLGEYYMNEKRARQEMQMFFANSVLRQIVELDQDWSVRLVENRNLKITDDTRLLVFQWYAVDYLKDGESVTLEMQVKSSRTIDKYTRASHWTVLEFQQLE